MFRPIKRIEGQTKSEQSVYSKTNSEENKMQLDQEVLDCLRDAEYGEFDDYDK